MNKQVSFDNEQLILVDGTGEPIGSKPKLQCHQGHGILHKAFSVFVFNSRNQVLLQKRSAEKNALACLLVEQLLQPPPRYHEAETEAAHRRISEELGIEVDNLEKHFDFEYRATYKDVGSEWERCSVFTAFSDDEVEVNPSEIEDTRWVPSNELANVLAAETDRFTPWIKLEWKQLLPLIQFR